MYVLRKARKVNLYTIRHGVTLEKVHILRPQNSKTNQEVPEIVSELDRVMLDRGWFEMRVQKVPKLSDHF